MTKIPPLAGLAEVAGLAGVTRQRAFQLTQVKTFPKPVQVLAATPVWLESDVVTFLGTPRAPGRPRLRTLNPETR